jgi:hypothetical protein
LHILAVYFDIQELFLILTTVFIKINKNMINNYDKVAVIVYDDLRPHCDDIRDNLIDFTLFKLGGKHKLNIFQTKEITKTLTELTNTDYEWAVVIAVGHYIHSQETVFETIEVGISENSPLVCHILEKGGYFNFHQQWFALNLKVYKEVGTPSLEYIYGEHPPHVLPTFETERSIENIHDDYTPLWIKPSSNKIITYECQTAHFGTLLVSALINARHLIVNLPMGLRTQKSYAYADFCDNDIRAVLANPDTVLTDERPFYWFNIKLKDLVGNLNLGYYVLNTETLIKEEELSTQKFDCFMGVCGGLKPAYIVGGNNFSDNTRVCLFDISKPAIEWQQYLRANWDGDFSKFEAMFKDFQFKNPTYRPLYHSQDSILDNIIWFLDNAGIDANEFSRRWNKYLGMNVEFTSLDLLADNIIDQLNSFTGQSTEGAYIWTSNAFNMDYLTFYKTKKWIDQYSSNFINSIKEKSPIPTVLENCGSLYFSQSV